MDTVTISIERFKNLEACEKAVFDRKSLQIYYFYSHDNRYYVCDDVNQELINKNQELANNIQSLKNQIEELKNKKKSLWQRLLNI